MARTAVTTGLAKLATDAGVAAPTPQAADATNGNYVPFTVGSSYGPFNTFLIVANGDSSPHSIILRGSGYTGAPAGAANSGILPPQNTVFAGSTSGDLAVAVPNATTQYIGPLTTDRFTQADGTLWIDWSAATSMTVIVVQLPVVVS
jgi:hypothetical protein